MAKLKRTNRDGYKAVMEALANKGHKFPQASLGRLLGLTRQGIEAWDHIIPEAYAFRVSILTGVAMETILPETLADMQSQLAEMK